MTKQRRPLPPRRGVTVTVFSATSERPEIEVRSSRKRTKTATARLESGRVIVSVPAHVSGAAREELVDSLVAKVLSRRVRRHSGDEALLERASALGRRYLDGVTPTSVRFVDNQRSRWASCTAATGEIRLSRRLEAVPGWVLDAVLVHELAHLVHQDHSAAFHALSARYPRQREATIFLEGYHLGLNGPEEAPALPEAVGFSA